MKTDYIISKMELTIEGENVQLVEQRLRMPDDTLAKPTFYLKGSDFFVTLGNPLGDQFFIRPALTGPESNRPLAREFNSDKRNKLGNLLIALVYGQAGMPLPVGQ